MIRVFVADDHAIVREGIERMLSAMAGMECVGSAADADGLLAAASLADADVLVLDLSMPGGGLQLVERVRGRHDGLQVVVYSMYPEAQFGPSALRAGAAAYLTKGRPTAELVDALRRAAAGRKYVTQDIAERLLMDDSDDRPPHERLSPREREIFQQLVEGASPSDIAEALHISKPTVSTHIRHIKDKMGVSSVAEMVDYAHRARLRM